MLQLLSLLVWVSFVFGLCVLSYVSISDLRRRLVSNWIWVLAYPIGCAMTLASIVFNVVGVGVVLVSFGCCLFLGLVLFYSGFYGGADVKALIFIGLTIPTLPLTFNPALRISALPLILIVYCLSSILSLVWPLSIFGLNLKDLLVKRKPLFDGISLTMRQKVWLLFTARKIPIEKFGSLRYFPAEQVVLQKGEPTRVLVHFVKAETDLKKHLDNLEKYRELYHGGVLASPTIPSACFLTAALTILPLANLPLF